MNGHIIRKVTMFVSSIFYLHRNPKHWGNDAHLFKPERFEDKSIKNVHPYAFIPFTGEMYYLEPSENFSMSNEFSYFHISNF